jgi:hypothetical protein
MEPAMRTGNLIATFSSIVLLAAVAAAPAMAQPNYGNGGYGPGMMGGYGVGPGMMGGYGMMGRGMMGGYGMGPGMMGPNMMGPGMMDWRGDYRQFDLNLSANDVKNYFERVLAFRGNPHVKVGSVAEMDANTVSVDIVTTDKEGLVQRFNVDRRTGMFRPA